MVEFIRKRFDEPDDVLEYPLARLEIVEIGDKLIWRLVAQPGWRYTESVSPVDGSPNCPGEHLFMVVESGRLGVQMENGRTEVYEAGDVGSIPPGHDAWVVGDELTVAVGIDRAPA
jgi:hypothetical protein